MARDIVVKNRSCLLSFLLTAVLCQVQLVYGKNSPEQTDFSAEESGVRRPVAIPPDVFTLLKHDKMVQDALRDGNIDSESLPAKWFSASAIHLSNSRAVDLIVVGEPPLAGTNVVTFWVFRKSSRGYELVLTSGAHNLRVRNHRTKGYRDLAGC
jgi:hypothetical protein